MADQVSAEAKALEAERNAETQHVYGTELVMSGQPREAIQYLQRATELDSSRTQAFNNLASVQRLLAEREVQESKEGKIALLPGSAPYELWRNSARNTRQALRTCSPGDIQESSAIRNLIFLETTPRIEKALPFWQGQEILEMKAGMALILEALNQNDTRIVLPLALLVVDYYSHCRNSNLTLNDADALPSCRKRLALTPPHIDNVLKAAKEGKADSFLEALKKSKKAEAKAMGGKT